jgi:hypothetical protein
MFHPVLRPPADVQCRTLTPVRLLNAIPCAGRCFADTHSSVAGKIGLLPKRPVSLANAELQPSRAHDDDEEELEYVENPFEEGKYS